MSKKAGRRVLSVLLAVSLCITTIPITSHAETLPSGDGSAFLFQSDVEKSNDATIEDEQNSSDGSFETAAISDETIIGEVSERREEYSKHFRLNNGIQAAVSYPYEVFAYDRLGENLIEINNRLSKETNGNGETYYIASDEKKTVTFLGVTNGLTYSYQEDIGSFEWGLEGISEKAEATYEEPKAEIGQTKLMPLSFGGILTYKDILPYTSLTYQPIGTSVKENIILREREAVREIPETGYSFILRTSNLIAKLSETSDSENSNQTIELTTRDGEFFGRITAPYMEDSSGAKSRNISLGLEETEDGYRITVKPDTTWLTDEARTFPVVIDPVFAVRYEAYTAMHTTSVISESPNSASMFNYGEYYIGYAPGFGGNHRAVLKINALPTLEATDVIIDATIEMVVKFYSGFEGVTVNFHEMTEDTNLWQLTWNNLIGKFSNIVLDSQEFVSSSVGSLVRFDITKAAKKWYNGENYGIAMTCENESAEPKIVWLHSQTATPASYRPVFVFTYRSQEGIEDYLTYHTAGNDISGVVAVSDYTGNMVYTYTDVAGTGNALPVTVQHIYSHAKRTLESIGTSGNTHFGKGFRLNLYQRIEPAEYPGYAYRYTDADGTAHYFPNREDNANTVGSTFTMEDSPLTILTKTASGYTLTGGGDLALDFNTSGFLVSIRDTLRNLQQTITYNGDRITKVTDGSGRETTFSYDLSGYLTAITDSAGRTTQYMYTLGLLVRIIRPDDTNIILNYNSASGTWWLQEILNPDGSITEVQFNYTVPYRTDSLAYLNNAHVSAQKLTYRYLPGETLITDALSRTETMLFDTYGHTVVVRDHTGKAVYGGYDGGTNVSRHTLLYQSKLQAVEKNYLQNGDFEDSTLTGWTFYETEYSEGSYGSLSTTNAIGEQCYSLFTSSQCFDENARVAYLSQDVILPEGAGKEVTFSVNASCSQGGYIGIEYTDISGNLISEKTPCDTSIDIFHEDFMQCAVTMHLPETFRDYKVTVWIGTINYYEYQVGGRFDNAKLVIGGATDNQFNLLDNGFFDNSVHTVLPSSWQGTGLENGDEVISETLDGTAYRLRGNMHAEKTLYQTISQSDGATGARYVFNAWAKADSLHKENKRSTETNPLPNRIFAVAIRFLHTDGTYQEKVFDFEAKTSGWQFLSGEAIADSAFTGVQIRLIYSYQKNEAVFDNIALYEEGFGDRMTYDDEGRLLTVTDPENRVTTYTYRVSGKKDLSRVDYPDGTSETYTYDSTGRILSSIDRYGIVTNYTYDTYGNVIKTGTTVGSGDDALTTESVTDTYNINYRTESSDIFGNTAYYTVDPTRGVLQSVENPLGVITNYTYDSDNDRLTTVSSEGSSVSYTYLSTGELSTLQHNTTEYSHDNVIYSFNYDSFGNRTSVKVGNNLLASYSYNTATGDLLTTTYGTGDTTENIYDSAGRITGVKENGTTTLRNYYDREGRVGYIEDLKSGVNTRYSYDKKGNLSRIHSENPETGDRNSTVYTYDENGLLLTEETILNNPIDRYETLWYDPDGIGATKHLTGILYFGIDRTSTWHTESEDIYWISYTYDELNRKKTARVECRFSTFPAFYTLTYHYKENANGVTSSLIDSVTREYTGIGENDEYPYYGTSETSYTYDANGNIETISEDGIEKVRYYYDGKNQLIREDNHQLDKTILYTYDEGGNLLSESGYSYTEGDPTLYPYLYTHTYQYANGDWKDQLTFYDDNLIVYDEIGNPLIYYNGSSFTWENGRKLTEISTYDNQTISYDYDALGNRIRKTVGDTETEYTYVDGHIIGENEGDDWCIYYYDENGVPTGFCHMYETVLYVTNVLGDVTGLMDFNGNVFATYTYDSWGKVVSINATSQEGYAIASENPLRYRGYYYDNETGFYYLGSRYYDPEVRRFINADGQLAIGGDLTGLNLYAYCGNNPINRVDPTGEAWWHWALAVVVVAACAVATVVTCGGFAAAATAVCMVANGVAATTTASTIAAGAFIGSATALGMSALTAAGTSNSVQEFNDQGNWGTVAATAGGGLTGGFDGYAMSKAQGAQCATDENTFLPDNFYEKHAPKQSTPNTSYTNYTYNSYTGEYEKSTAYYDCAGRQVIRIDWTNHGYPSHGNPHVHYTTYNSQYRDGFTVRWD